MAFDRKAYMREYYKRNRKTWNKRPSTPQLEPEVRNRWRLVVGLRDHLATGKQTYEFRGYADMKPREVQIARGELPWPKEWPQEL